VYRTYVRLSSSEAQDSGLMSVIPPRRMAALSRPPPRCTLPRVGGLTFDSVEDLADALRGESYLADRGLATAIYLAVSLDKPLLLEGEAGVGKTEVAKVLASLLGRELIRLQCYEGIDAAQALYEWNYSRQLIAVRAMQTDMVETHVEEL